MTRSDTLEQPTSKAGDRRKARRARHDARQVLWRESNLRRLRYCGKYAAGETVTLLAGGEQGSGFSGVQSCGSVWVCPVCSEKVNAVRRNELQAGAEAWLAAGGGLAFGTLTLSHHGGDRLAALWDAIGPAWTDTTSRSEGWRGRGGVGGDRDTFGIAGYVRVVEVKHGRQNGWHPHVHFILFLDAPLTEPALERLAARMFTRWQRSLEGHGIRTSWKHGVDLRPVSAADGITDYLTKSTYRSTPAAAAYEVTGSHSKTAGKGGRTPFELLSDVVSVGDANDLDLWHEWERASKGRRQLTWSRGLRQRLQDLGAEVDALDDQAIVDESAGGVELLEVTREGYRRIVDSGRLVDVLEAADTATTWEAAAAVLEDLRVQYWPPGYVHRAKPQAA